MMSPQKIYLKEYQEPNYFVETTELKVNILSYENVEVQTTYCFKRNSKSLENTLVLTGDNIDLRAVVLNDKPLSSSEYMLEEDTSELSRKKGKLTLKNCPETFTLQLLGGINPAQNKANSGLYQSGDMLCTQCESQGFRRISYALDRPDVMSIFTVHITADKQTYPYLLSNGNKIAETENKNGTHTVTWHDPHKKPTYLFALVAGDLLRVEDVFTTMSGKTVDIHFYADKNINPEELTYGVNCLKKAMKWDEDTFGLEYDLGLYQVVASSSFNMGAMENKGLNIFNTVYVLGNEKSATDAQLEAIDAVIAHEYFHNWTGNRVTCRDWFQLSLKEGLTVFRDSRYTEDMTSSLTKRIADVQVLKEHQFKEDAGPNAHPIRPHFFTTIRNFYTVTVYEKGAEVIRMIYNILGKEGFRNGMDLYFKRHDGSAVTTEDFVSAMADANDVDFTQFENWYNQGGTPHVYVTEKYDPETKTFNLMVKQSVRTIEGYPKPKPFHIPLAVGLLNQKGENLLKGNSSAFTEGTEVLDFKKEEQTFIFENIEEKPVLSFLRHFSAPVFVHRDVSTEDLFFLLKYDTDAFNRWDAGQQLFTQLIKDAYAEKEICISALIDALKDILQDTTLSNMVKAEMIKLPTESLLHTQMSCVDVQKLNKTYKNIEKHVANALQKSVLKVYETHANPTSPGERALKNKALSLLCKTDVGAPLAEKAFKENAGMNMTNELAAFSAILLENNQESTKEKAIEAFYDRWKNHTDVVDKWLKIQASIEDEKALERVKKLMDHPAVDMENPNKIRAVVGGFLANLPQYHTPEGYRFHGDEIIRIDAFNPELASRLSLPLTMHKMFAEKHKKLMVKELKRIQSQEGLSVDLQEIIGNALA